MLSKLIQLLTIGLLAIVPLCALVTMYTYLRSYPELMVPSDILFVILGIILWFCAIYFFIKNKTIENKKIIIWLCLITSNIIMILFLFVIPTEPVSDYLIIWNTAKEMANNNYDALALPYYDYMHIYNYQTGMAWFESLFIRCFGPIFWPLKLFNLIWINFTFFTTWFVTKRLFNETTATISFLLIVTYFPILITVNQITNQHIVTPLILLSLYCLTKNDLKWWLIAGAIAAFLNVFRAMGILITLTALTYFIILLINKNDKKKPILFIFFYFIGLFTIQFTADYLFMVKNYADGPISKSTLPYFKFHKGLTDYNTPELDKFYSVEKFNQWEQEQVIGTLIKEPIETSKFVANKICRYLGEADWKYHMTFNHCEFIDIPSWGKKLNMFGWGQYIVLSILALIGFISTWKRKGIGPIQIFFLGNILVYFFIEAFSSYRYESYPILTIMAATGILSLVTKKNQIIENRALSFN